MPKPKKAPKALITTEATSYLDGLFHEFHKQTHQYHELTKQLLSLEGRIELAEKTLCLTRDHLAMAIERSDSAGPKDWDEVFKSVRFVGIRLADACQTLLQKHGRLTPQAILSGLNLGMYRFRTSSPLREIHAALLRQSFVKREGQHYVWIGRREQQIPLRLRVMKVTAGMGKEETQGSVAQKVK
jgi:hypothetical protein